MTALASTFSSAPTPIDGRIGRAMVTEGALVGQGEVTQLALIQQIDMVYVNMSQSSAEILQLRRAIKSGLLKGAENDEVKVKLVMEDSSVYPHEGKLLFSDITVDESTGSLMLRAAFPNQERLLLPGTFVRVRLQLAVNEAAITVPQQAVQRSSAGTTVMVVGAEEKVEARAVKTSSSQGDAWVIEDGLKAGERVIVEGLQKVRPGMTVKAVAWKKQDKPGAAAAGPSASAPAASPAPEASTPAAAPAALPPSAPAPAAASAPPVASTPAASASASASAVSASAASAPKQVKP